MRGPTGPAGPPGATGPCCTGPTGATGSDEPEPQVITQADWFVNAETGNDANDGATPATALQSFAELTRRFGIYNILQPDGGVVSINVGSDMPFDDPFTLLAILGQDVIVRLVGTVTADASGVMAVVPKNPAINQPYVVTDPAAPWGQLSRIALDSIPGAFAWGALDLGAGSLRTSDFNIPDGPFTVTPVTPGPIEPYTIQRLSQISLGAISLFGTTSTGSGFVFFVQDFEFYPGAFVLPPSSVRVVFMGCRFNQFSSFISPVIYFLNCAFNATNPPGIFFYGGDAEFHGGITLQMIEQRSGVVTLEADFMFQAIDGGDAHVEAEGGAQLNIGQAAGFDSATHGLHIHANNLVELISSIYGPARLWGIAGPGAYGIDVDSGAIFRIAPGITPTLTGGLGDFELADVPLGRAWSDTLSAYTPLFPTTWINFNTVFAPDGVRNAHNVALRASIIDAP